MEAQAGYPPQGAPGPGKPMERPTGVTILAVLYIINGLIALAGPFILVAWIGSMVGMGLEGISALTASALGIGILSCFIIVALIDFLIAVGLLKGKGWARTLALIFAIISLLNVPIGTVLGIIIIYYLTRPQVKAWFQ